MHEPLLITRSTTFLKRWLTLTLAVCALGAQAQNPVDDPDWKETEVPTPPVFSTSRLLAIEMPPYVTLTFGVDPATIAITPDGIVRYVVVTSNTAGSTNAMYEGVRCSTAEVKTYARASSGGVWSQVKEPQWRNLYDNLPSKHALALARQGVCSGAAASNSVADIIKNLKH